MAKAIELVGIDLGGDSIKIAQVSANQGLPTLKSLYKAPTNREVMHYENEEQIDVLAQDLKKHIKEAKITTKDAVMAIPEEQVFSRMITLPVVQTEEELNEALHYALKPLIPVPLDQVFISKLKIDQTVENDRNVVNWYVVAAPVQKIRSTQRLAQKVGLDLKAIETEAIAVTRSVYHGYKFENDCIILDIGADASNIILTRKSSIVFSQNVNTGSDAITKVIQADFGVDSIQAEEYKKAFGLDITKGEGKITKSIIPIVDIIVSEVSRTVTYFREKISSNVINAMYITGGGSSLPLLSQYINDKLRMETILVNGMQNIIVQQNLSSKLESMNANSFNVALGLSMKGIYDLA